MFRYEAEKHLKEKILPFWENLTDPGQGGYYGMVDRELNVFPNADKGCILHARILWTFSTAARVLKDAGLRKHAEHAYNALCMFEDSLNGGVYWSITFDGKPADTAKHTYCQAFAIYGLAAYYRLTGHEEALKKAEALFRIIEERCTVQNGYGEAYKADFTPESNEKLSENGILATRTMNTLLHVLESYTELYRAAGNEEVRQAGIRILKRFLNDIYIPDRHQLKVFMDEDYQPLLDIQSYGHDIEASWLVWDSAEALLPPETRDPYREMCLDLVSTVRERAFTEYGLLNECVNGTVNRQLIWWVQAETVLGFANAFRLTGKASWGDDLLKEWESIQTSIVDPRPQGEWFWSLLEDGTLTGPIAGEWKCPYHNGRMCLRVIENNLQL